MRASSSMKARRSSGIIGVKWHIGAPRLQHGQEPHHHRRRTANAQAHEDLGANAQGAEAAGQPVGPGIELCISERLAGSSSRPQPPGSARPGPRSCDGRTAASPRSVATGLCARREYPFSGARPLLDIVALFIDHDLRLGRLVQEKVNAPSVAKSSFREQGRLPRNSIPRATAFAPPR